MSPDELEKRLVAVESSVAITASSTLAGTSAANAAAASNIGVSQDMKEVLSLLKGSFGQPGLVAQVAEIQKVLAGIDFKKLDDRLNAMDVKIDKMRGFVIATTAGGSVVFFIIQSLLIYFFSKK